MMAKNKYMMKVSLSVNGVNKLLKFSKVLQKDMPTLEKRFVEKSLALYKKEQMNTSKQLLEIVIGMC